MCIGCVQGSEPNVRFQLMGPGGSRYQFQLKDAEDELTLANRTDYKLVDFGPHATLIFGATRMTLYVTQLPSRKRMVNRFANATTVCLYISTNK